MVAFTYQDAEGFTRMNQVMINMSVYTDPSMTLKEAVEGALLEFGPTARVYAVSTHGSRRPNGRSAPRYR